LLLPLQLFQAGLNDNAKPKARPDTARSR
jgi:hypothetical protein